MRTADRVPHIIRANKSGSGPQTWVVLSVTTTPVRLERSQWQYVFKLATAIIWRKARATRKDTIQRVDFTTAAALVEWVASRPGQKERICIVADNMDFVAQVLDIHGRLRTSGYNLTRAVTEKGKWVQRWTRGSRRTGLGAQTLQFVDLGNFFPISMHELASWLGMKRKRKPAPLDSDERWQAYTIRDAEICLAAIQRWLEFLRENDLGYFAPTIAGQAFNAFRHRFMCHQIFVHVHDDVIALERASNYGGRCQDFWRGRAPNVDMAHLDINSNYGAILYDETLPVKQIGHLGRVSVRVLENLLSYVAAIALVRVRTDAPMFPRRMGNIVQYPIGAFDTALATPELKLAIDSGYLEEVYEVVTYETAPIGMEYAAYFWNLRQQARERGDEFTAKLCKRFLISLHGKFGQRIFTSRLVMTGADREDEVWTEYDIEDGQWYEFRSLAGRVEQRIREVQGRDTLVAIPAHVASYARVKLWRLIALAGFENVLYVDTDSLIVKRKGLDRLRDSLEPDVLGGLRIVNQSRFCYIRGPKWYRFGSEIRRAGVSSNAVELGGDKFEQDNIHSGKWSLSHGYAHSAIVEQVEIDAPYRNLLPKSGLGHWVPWVRAEEQTQ